MLGDNWYIKRCSSNKKSSVSYWIHFELKQSQHASPLHRPLPRHCCRRQRPRFLRCCKYILLSPKLIEIVLIDWCIGNRWVGCWKKLIVMKIGIHFLYRPVPPWPLSPLPWPPSPVMKRAVSSAVPSAVSSARLGTRPGRTVMSPPGFYSSKRTTFSTCRNRKFTLSKLWFVWNSFIKAHPEYQSKFSKFASVPQAELMTNGNFLAQAYTILAGLNVVVQSMSSTELLASQINALGGAHQPRGITVPMFEVCLQIIAKYLRIITKTEI